MPETMQPYQPPPVTEQPVAAAPNSTTPSTAGKFAGAVGGAVGGIFGVYAGAHLIVPLGIAALVCAVTLKLTSRRPLPMLIPFAIQFAHGCWILLGILLLGHFDLNLIDVALLLGGALWLVLRPGIWPVAILFLYQLPVLLINLTRLTDAELASPFHRALAVHALLRVIAMAMMAFELYKLRNRSRTSSPQ